MINDLGKRNIFLNYLAQIYIQNPELPISSDTIYSELCSFNVEGTEQKKISRTNLVPVQTALGREFPKNSWSNGNFLIFENRNNRSDSDYYNSIIDNGIKIYVAVDETQIYSLSQNLFNYILQDNITAQCSVSKKMRNDSLVVRVSSKEEAEKIVYHLNSLRYLDKDKKTKYKPKIHPNPFTFYFQNASIAMDGKLSYNYTLSKLIEEYLNQKRINNSLSEVSSEDFKNFLINLYQKLKDNNSLIQKYSNGNDKDFIMILNLIIDTMDNKLSLNNVLNYKNNFTNINNKKEEDIKYTDEERQMVISIIAALEKKYSISEMHARILKYFETENINLFTREFNIRKTVAEKFPPQKMKKIISDIGFDTLIEASYDTIEARGTRQLEYAIDFLLNEKGLDGFNNTINYSRSKLGYIIPTSLLIETIKKRVEEEGYNYDLSGVYEMICDFIESKKLNKDKEGKAR